MDFLRNLKIRTKLIYGFSLMIFLLLVTGFAGYSSSTFLFGNMKLFYSVELPSMDNLIEADRDLQQLLVSERTMIFAGQQDKEMLRTLQDDYEVNLKQVKERMEHFAKLSTNSKAHELYRQFLAALKEWEPVSRQVVKEIADQPEAAIALSLGDAQEKFEKMRDFIDQSTEVLIA